jgi:TRAP-type C4-dicarboxylate transport system permease small subunit
MLFGFAMMAFRAVLVAWRHWRQGYSVLERPETAIEDRGGMGGFEEPVK